MGFIYNNCMKNFGFTLAELLIALAILGVIATFTIPKILSSSNDSQLNAIAKEVAGTISNAYQEYKTSNTIDSNTGPADLTHYMNYVSVDSLSTIDHLQTTSAVDCSAGSYTCLKLHSGAYLYYRPTGHFDGVNTTNAIWFALDPDGKYSGTTTGSGKSISFWLYTNGRLKTYGTLEPNTYDDFGLRTANSAYDPPWFSW